MNKTSSNLFQRAMGFSVVLWTLEYMKIVWIIVRSVQIYVVNNVPFFCICNNPMHQLSAFTDSAVSEPVRLIHFSMWSHRFTYLWACLRNGLCKTRNRAHGQITSFHGNAMRQAADFLFIREKRITVSMPHLVVSHTHLFRNHRTVAVLALAANHSASPSVFRTPVFSDAFVVHQAVAMACVFPAAISNRAAAILFNIHAPNIKRVKVSRKEKSYKALGNSFAVPVINWLGRRIELVDQLSDKE